MLLCSAGEGEDVSCSAPKEPAAQEGRRRLAVSLGPALSPDGDAIGWSFHGGYALTPRISLQAEIGYALLDFGEFPACPPDLICAAIVGGTNTLTGDVVQVHGHLVFNLAPSGRARPYVFGGGGYSSVRRELRHQTFNTLTIETTAGPGISFGAGVDFPIGGRWALGAEGRYDRAFGDRRFGRDDIPSDSSWTRIAAVISYRH